MDLGAPELALIVLAALLLFGYQKLPEASRALGRSLRIFRSEMRGLQDDGHPSPAAPREPDLEAQVRAAEAAAAQARARANAARAAVSDAPR
jgi:sec-independent protein translocase protein TatA